MTVQPWVISSALSTKAHTGIREIETRNITVYEDGLPATMHDARRSPGGQHGRGRSDRLVPTATSNLTPATTTAEGEVAEVGPSKEKVTIRIPDGQHPRTK
jgi:hypothetical protein